MTTITVSTSMTFPFVKVFGDYHEIDHYAEDLNGLFDETIRCAEVGFSGQYWGVYYIGRKPAKAVIDKLLEDAGFVTLFCEEDDDADAEAESDSTQFTTGVPHRDLPWSLR